MCEDEGRGKYHPGAQAARGGTHFPEFSKPRSGASYLTLLRFCRSTIRSLSTCGMRSRTMRIVSLSLISCWEGIFGVRPSGLTLRSIKLMLPLLVHLERLGSLSEEVVRYYVAEIASALSFLHEKRIIHRYVA